MKKLDKNKIGLFTGGTIAFFNLVWSILVVLGIAQVLLDFVFSLHFLNNPFVVSTFDPIKFLTLLIVTFVSGYVIGWASTFLWNKLINFR